MPTVDIVPAPPAPPTITNDIVSQSVNLLNPPYVQRKMEELTYQRFLTPVLFGKGPDATGGAVSYDQITENDLYPERDVQSIAPGAKYPRLGAKKPTPKMALVEKWGGEIEIFDEDIDRSGFGVVQRSLVKLRNDIVRKVDAYGLRVLDAAPVQTYTWDATWASSDAQDIIDGFVEAREQIWELDMGYNPNTVILNTASAGRLQALFIKDKLLGETAQESLVRGSSVGQILGWDIYSSNQVPAGEGWYLDRDMVGDISDEVPLQTKVYREESNDSNIVKGSRRFTAFVTDPLAVIKMDGL